VVVAADALADERELVAELGPLLDAAPDDAAADDEDVVTPAAEDAACIVDAAAEEENVPMEDAEAVEAAKDRTLDVTLDEARLEDDAAPDALDDV